MGTKTSIDVVIRIANRDLALVMSVLDKGLLEEMIQLLGVSSLLLSQSALRSNMDLAASRAGDRLSGKGDTKCSSYVDSASGWFSGSEEGKRPCLARKGRKCNDKC
ncbi:hypothetical protein L1987_33338 [Smallanthus sonchifolius]|uniref:Uncharacterized protein n=1 Tax=Smallanthus sonchifolius TaxID=185202 RepID=A0ACB9HS39_9ASTR|nr:hypothetical protein L1987_33338 [Smallanthus sonchifolius]